MKFTTVHINSIILSFILATIQMYVVWEIEQNGGLSQYIKAERMPELAMIFSPTAGIVWALRSFSDTKGDD